MATQADPIVRRLQVLGKEQPELKEIASIYSAILPLLQDANLVVSTTSLDKDAASAKLKEGIPLLHGQELGFDEFAAQALLIRLARALENVPEDIEASSRKLWILGDRRKKPRAETEVANDDSVRATSARQIRLMLERGELPAGRLLGLVAAGDIASVITLAEDGKLDSGLLWTLGQHALKPAFRAWHDQVEALVRPGTWHHDYCPICGADALLGELQGNAGELHLRCGQCGADWTMPRLECVHCGSDDPALVKYYYEEEQRENMRVEVCDNCRGYFKMVAAFTPNPVQLLPAIDLATIHLDMIAHGRGYAQGQAAPRKVLDF